MGVEEDIDEGGGDCRQRLRVQCEDTKAVLRALNGMHRGTGPCSVNRGHKVKGYLGLGRPLVAGQGKATPSHTLRVFCTLLKDKPSCGKRSH